MPKKAKITVQKEAELPYFEDKFKEIDYLKISIQEKLNSRRKSNSKIIIRINCVSVHTWALLKVLLMKRKGQKFGINSVTDLDPAFGEGWSFRIINKHGDTCRVITETLSIWFYRRPDLKCFRTDGSVKKMSRGNALGLSFVREDLNRQQAQNSGLF